MLWLAMFFDSSSKFVDKFTILTGKYCVISNLQFEMSLYYVTIMLEAGDINRFAKVGSFASYSRCVSSQRLSDGKSKGHGNRKNGNRYLSWAFTEAAHLSRRYNEHFRSYYNRKVAQANTSLATKALSNKLARICHYIMRDQVPFKEQMF